MTQDDPFHSKFNDRTILVPSPGGRNQKPASPSGDPGFDLDFGSDDRSTPATGINPLVAAANPLLNVVSQLRNSTHHGNPAALRESLARDIKAFESRAAAAGVDPKKIVAARYVLCTLLDEVAATTPWGGSGVWGNHSLLVAFHNEAWGGEKVFQLMAKLAENPAANRDILELIYICLALGFEGRYRVIDNGRAALEAVRERLAQLLGRDRHFERDLAPHWQGAAVKRQRVFYVIPLWVALAGSALVLVGAYIGFTLLLNSTSDPVFAKISAIRVGTVAPKPPPVSVPRLSRFLSKEIAAGLVDVNENPSRSIVTMRGDGLFDPGSTSVQAAFEPVLMRIAEGLNAVPGRVLITGHTDDQPIHTARFPSNWHLSLERARSVMLLLATKVPSSRLSAEGRADTEPIVPNDSAANRARNRRVEVILFVSNPGAQAATGAPGGDNVAPPTK